MNHTHTHNSYHGRFSDDTYTEDQSNYFHLLVDNLWPPNCLADVGDGPSPATLSRSRYRLDAFLMLLRRKQWACAREQSQLSVVNLGQVQLVTCDLMLLELVFL